MQKEKQQYGPLMLDPRAYRFFPTKKEEKTQFTKKGTRFFYYGQIEHDEYEQKKLKEFHEFVAQNKVNYDKNYYNNDQILLLFLQGNSYKPKDALNSMENNLALRKQYLPQTYENNKKAIDSGFMYPCGRDKFFRPIIVFNAKLIDWENVQNSVKATCFVHQEVIEKMFIPGQVETWVVIYDLGGLGLTQMPISAIKAVSAKMSVMFSGRLGKLYTVNAPTSVYFGYKTVSGFLDPVTVDKIKVSKSNTEKALFQIADKSQVEEKYGGTQPNRKVFWPFTIPEGVFDEKRLTSDKEYEQMFKEGKLKRNEIDPRYKK